MVGVRRPKCRRAGRMPGLRATQVEGHPSEDRSGMHAAYQAGMLCSSDRSSTGFGGTAACSEISIASVTQTRQIPVASQSAGSKEMVEDSSRQEVKERRQKNEVVRLAVR